MDDLIVPSWVMKDHSLYRRIRRRGFSSQRALDHFITDEAARRHLNRNQRAKGR